MASTDVSESGDADTSSQNTSSSEGESPEPGTLEQDEVSNLKLCQMNPPQYPEPTSFTQGHFPFLRLPAEVRNEIYFEALQWEVDRLDGRAPLLYQPPITRVNRQTRAEALRIYYVSPHLEVKSRTSNGWVPFVRRVLDAFTGGPGGLPGGSSQCALLFPAALQLSFMTKDQDVQIEVEFHRDPEKKDMWVTLDGEGEAVVVGDPDLDWTDSAAAQAACDEAADKLADDIERRTAPDEDDNEFVVASRPEDHEAALEALRLFALACPSVRASVCICDNSEVNFDEAAEDWSTDGDGPPGGYDYTAHMTYAELQRHFQSLVWQGNCG